MAELAEEPATEAVARHTGRRAARTRRLSSLCQLVEPVEGAPLVVKESLGPDEHAAAAAALRWLSGSDFPPVPMVHGVDETWLVIDYVPPGAPSVAAAEEFGRSLSALHASGAPGFGAPPPGGPADAWIGRTRMRNETRADWPEFYASLRIEPYVRVAVDQGVLDDARARVFEQVCARLDTLAGPAEPPARLHGDLWNGNVHWAADGRAWLIDPAAHGGHRETDLAMLALFGCPQLERVLGAYQESAPLAAGWRQRVALHQLFPLLVHTVLFGGGYTQQAVSAAHTALRAG
ncbi:fructosamine-3-kinase [Tamaricihabitans halophyticus]|uniref:Fructosamine-3-kinase n=1 Tax=Tamaricihabitans halophyticus TaxID=1262583 RepID=A0A4R2QHJ2_9PSEU|nr:fructosamine kinase family protein [Tamaricihabitans halophyticus]TCP48637.1 fructosamine-3-kinase [Tamaricihabitans halophyticus]